MLIRVAILATLAAVVAACWALVGAIGLTIALVLRAVGAV